VTDAVVEDPLSGSLFGNGLVVAPVCPVTGFVAAGFVGAVVVVLPCCPVVLLLGPLPPVFVCAQANETVTKLSAVIANNNL
jgi:hypothetical protein